ncbi:hypothetical protein AK812_SmicGene21642 [Symbiodinium microadriaticum]|uniref:Protein kinase domain-containing protein n=1 Tax=Symbiodinium microadriaticum TaxID=2951 RepID=A0A1Q9DLW9_SYMMI|nr:hypothetical protein AK812_SmicGene21642 [Symbiodinium microadriaticum]
MARPGRKPGQTPVQVICSLLRPESAAPPPPPPPATSEVSPVDDGYVGREIPAPPPPAAQDTPQTQRVRTLVQEVERLQARITELEEENGMGLLKRKGIVSFTHVGQDDRPFQVRGNFKLAKGGLVAVKKLFDPNISAELLAEFDNEVQKLELLRCPISSIPPRAKWGQQANQAVNPRFDVGFQTDIEEVSPRNMSILDATATAMAFLHARGIAHRDIKSHNVKLCDFGLAKLKSELMTGSMQRPALQTSREESVDVFAFGTLLWEAMANDIPFARGQMLEMPSLAPREVQQLIRNCWTLDYKVRPTMAEVLQSLRSCRDADKEDWTKVCRQCFRGGTQISSFRLAQRLSYPEQHPRLDGCFRLDVSRMLQADITFERLEELSLDGELLEAEALALLPRRCPRLQSLTISFAAELDGQALASLAQLHYLEALALKKAPKPVDDEYVQHE